MAKAKLQKKTVRARTALERSNAKAKYRAKPDAAEKAASKQRLKDKGVDDATATHLAGEGEDMDREELLRRRIDWCKTLTRSA